MATNRKVLAAYRRGQREFHGVDLSRADLSDAVLSDANFSTANLSRSDLSGADLSRSDLTSTDLTMADVSWANLYRADLENSNLVEAMLESTDLRRAILIDSNLSYANLSGADLRGACLQGADLNRANLVGARLEGADFSGATFGRTVLVGVDLGPLATANPPIVLTRPSYVDHETVVKSVQCPGLEDLLLRLGVPEIFVGRMIEGAHEASGDVFNLHSTFISYGTPDEAFARRLNEFLHRNGVTTFFYPVHAVAGERLRDLMSDGVNGHDRVIVVCSRASLDRTGVANELEEALAREARDGGATYVIPVRLDDYVLGDWCPPKPSTARAIRDRVVADFTGADGDERAFDAAALKLLKALKKRPVPPSP